MTSNPVRDAMLPINYQPSNSAVYYTPPRKLDVGRTVSGLLGAMVGVICGGAVYSMIMPEVRSTILRVVGVSVAAIVAGIISRATVKRGRVCSPAIGAIIGCFLGLLALYVMWLVWLYQLLHADHVKASLGFLILHPVRFVRIIRALMFLGTLRIKGDLIKGVPLFLLWVAESAAILSGAVMFAVKAVGLSETICPKCGGLCKQACRPARYADDRPDEMVAAILSRDFASLGAYPPRRHEDDPELGLRLVSCSGCGQTHVLTLSRIAWGVANGKRVVVSTPLVNQLLISLEEAETVKSVSPGYKAEVEMGG